MMKGKTIVDTEKLQELLKLVRAFEDQLSAAEIATENGELMARDLHEALEIKTAFKDWFPRMTEYGFEAGKDFSSEMSKSTGGRPAVDYQISIDMAKQICMIQRNEKGRRCGSRMLTRENTDSALQRSKTTNRAAALPETVTRGRRTAAGY